MNGEWNEKNRKTKRKLQVFRFKKTGRVLRGLYYAAVCYLWVRQAASELSQSSDMAVRTPSNTEPGNISGQLTGASPEINSPSPPIQDLDSQNPSVPDNNTSGQNTPAQNNSTSGLIPSATGNNSAGQNPATQDSNAPGQNPAAPDNSTSGLNQAVPDNSASGQQATPVPDSPIPTPDRETSRPAGDALSVKGTQLVDESGNPVQLRGISTHGLSWYPQYVNQECFRQLKEEWCADLVRLAMYTAESGGYCTGGNKEDLRSLIENGVTYATECGLYVIIDWHILSDGNPNTYVEEAKEFFAMMSEKYAEYTNVLYEICNEPNGGTTWSDIKAYAEQIIEVIRQNDEDGIILVGTPNWSQYVDQAAADPITGYENIMYTLHFYAATHTDSLRSTMIAAIEKGLPVFVSEYGICDASGNGAIDTYQADQWVQTLDKYQISYVAWNLSNKQETSALFQNSCGKTSGFLEEDLSDSGKWLYEMLRATASPGDSTSSTEKENNGSPVTGTNSGNDSSVGPEESPNNDTPPSNNQSNTQTDTSTSDSTQTDPTGDGINITADLINSWQQNDQTYYQYTLTITNNTGADLNGWRIRLVFSQDITLSGSWNGNYQAEGNTLTISSMDYNGSISQGGSAENIGFILYGAENLEIREMSGI
jgi:endoglucanase